jgi:hypothetical protein
VDQREDDLGLAESVRARDAAVESSMGLDEAIRTALESVADAFFGHVGQMSSRPDELTVRFGVRLHYRDGAVVSSTDKPHFDVTMTWSRPPI